MNIINLKQEALSANWGKLADLIEEYTAQSFTYEEGLAVEEALGITTVSGLEVIARNVTNKIVIMYCKTLITNLKK